MGRGIKTCPKCKKETGPRAFKCPACGHDYNIKPSAKSVEKEILNKIDPNTICGANSSFNLIFVPGQSNKNKDFCPIKPKNSSEEEIIKWVESLSEYIEVSAGTRSKYARTAIKYFAEGFWPMYLKGIDGVNPEYSRVIEIIEDTIQPYKEEIIQGYEKV